MKEEEVIDMGNPTVAHCVLDLISAVGMEIMMNSWNHRRIPGTFSYTS